MDVTSSARLDDATDVPRSVRHQSASLAVDLTLDCGRVLRHPTIAYRTYGTLNATRSNAVLVCHALTGDQYAAERHPLTGRTGWWESVIGPGLPIDTDRFHVICSNVLGGCMGSTGPLSLDADGTTFGPDFPPITIADMVRAQALLLDHLGIERLFAAVGGSMGGMQVLAWMAHHPERLFAAVPIATAAQHSAQNIAFNEVSRQAITADPDFRDGRYAAAGVVPSRGLAVARMMAHITYLSEAALQRKFGRRVRRDDLARGLHATLFDDVFEVESYLRHQGSSFVQRFDANAYLTITRAMDWFDLAAEHDGDLAATFATVAARVCLVSFSSDWLFPTEEARSMARALNRAGVNVSFVEIETDRGHDAFLLDEPDFSRTLRGFLAGCAERAGLA